jgi:protein-disulfide isomerase
VPAFIDNNYNVTRMNWHRTRAAVGIWSSWLTTACVVALTGVVLHREFQSRTDERRGNRMAVRLSASDWRRIQGGGHRIGVVGAPVTIVTFSDFQCPFCARLANGVLHQLRQEYPTDVAIVFRHWPLPIHRYAAQAARAAECAADQGAFVAMHDQLFAQQDSIGKKSLTRLAADAGVPDSVQFSRCVGSVVPMPAVEQDIAEAHRLHAVGTPTVIINGRWLRGGVDSVHMDSIVAAELVHAHRE